MPLPQAGVVNVRIIAFHFIEIQVCFRFSCRGFQITDSYDFLLDGGMLCCRLWVFSEDQQEI